MLENINMDIVNAEFTMKEKEAFEGFVDLVQSLEGSSEIKAEIINEEKAKMEIIALSRKLLCGVSHEDYNETKAALELGADINSRSEFGNTALILATDRRNLEIVKLLLSHPEIDIVAANQFGDTALKVAERNGDEEIAINISRAKFCQMQTINNEKKGVNPIKVERADSPMNKIDHSRCYE